MSKALISTKLIKQAWRLENEASGRAFGFPKCCIDEFCDDPPELYKYKDKEQRKKDLIKYNAAHINGHWSGFIPCYKHALQIMNKEIKLNDLIKNRLPELGPFPNH